jgi:hypothetical protein
VDQLMVKVGDAELECFSHGDGVAIVMLPGGSLTVDYLSDLAEAVAGAGFRAIRVNLAVPAPAPARRTVAPCMTSPATSPG